MHALHATALALALSLSVSPPSISALARGVPGYLTPDFDLPAVALRVSLARGMGEHAILLIETLGAGLAGAEQFAASASALESNTVELIGLMEEAYGPEAAEAFGTQWRNHIAYLVDYTRAVSEGDEDARALAERQLERYVDDFSQLLSSANPTLPADVVRELIAEHGDQLAQVGQLASGEHEAAYTHIRDTYAHMYAVADALTRGILDQSPARFPGQNVAFSLALDLRIALDRLLGEHTMLAAVTMRSTLSGAADVEAAARALEANTADLGELVEVIYGADAGEAFVELWRSHTGYYVDYVQSVASGDVAGAAEAVDRLRDYEAQFADFMAEASPQLDAGQLRGMLHTHTTQLIGMVDAYDLEQFADAYEVVRSAYAHTEMLAAGLGAAIADQFPERFPDTAMAPIGSANHEPWPAVGYLIVAAAGALALMTRLNRSRPRSQSPVDENAARSGSAGSP